MSNGFTWDRAIEILILLAVLADILIWALDRKKQNLRDQKYLELQKQVVELLEDSKAELEDIADTVSPESEQV
jgi:hypothetical protein